MRREILMPPVTPSMVDGKIARWHVSEGQAVAAGDVLAEIATATATLEIEAEDAGHVERILVPAGTEGVKVNTPIAIVLAGVHRRAMQPLGFASLDALTPEPAHPATPVFAATGEQTYREALRDAIASEMRADADVFLIGVDVAQNRGAIKVAQGLLDAFGPTRVVAVPALDEALFGLAVGAAMAGLKPIVEVAHWGRAIEVMMPYLAEVSEAFYLSGGAMRVPIVFRGPNGYAPGATGQEARCVAGLLAQMPGLTVAQPATAHSAARVLAAAVRHPGPVCVLEHEQLYGARDYLPAEEGCETASTRRARVMRRGGDVTIAAAGSALLAALDAAEKLDAAGIAAEVIDLVYLRPLDTETVAASVARTGRLVTVEEGWGIGPLLSAAVTECCFRALKAAPRRVSGAEVPMPYAAELQTLAIPHADAIVTAATESVRG